LKEKDIDKLNAKRKESSRNKNKRRKKEKGKKFAIVISDVGGGMKRGIRKTS